MDPVFLAISRLRRRRFDDCIEICTELLNKNPLDQAVWYLKAKALTDKAYLDDTEMEDEGIAEMVLDDNAIAAMPRPGTSLRPPTTSSSTGTPSAINQATRPMSMSGRPISGYARPGTEYSRSSMQRLETSLQGNRLNTARPVTSSGRFVRIGTASMLSEPGGPFVDVAKLNLKKYAAKPALAKILFEYLLYHENNPMKALELAALATVENQMKDWWWKLAIGKCHYKLGLLREAERQLNSSIKDQDMLTTYLWLAKVYMRMDQPKTALETYSKALDKFNNELSLIIGIARLYESLYEPEKAATFYKKVLLLDSSNVEAIACIASDYFYNDQPELALRFYRRLLQMGVNNTEIWNNLGLCCFYAQQYDMTLSCFERALALADDENMADVWYNISQVAIGVGDVGLSYQAPKIATSIESNHAEAFNDLGVLELRKNNLEQARLNFQTSARLAPHLYQPLLNEAILLFRLGEFQDSFKLVKKVLELYPEHEEAKDLMKQLVALFL